MSTVVTADVLLPTADTTLITADQGFDGLIRQGWPCATLSDVPPSVADRQSDPSADDLLPQVLALTPRGPAWGTDEAGNGRGASPVMRLFWRALAAWSAWNNAREFEVATQVFPSAISIALADWEAELGLPDACFVGGSGTGARIAAVRARFGAQGGQSPAYFICLAKSLGYDITIEEPTQALVDVSECIGDGIAEGYFLCDESVCSGSDLVEAGLRCDDGACDDDPIEAFAPGTEGDGDPIETFTLYAVEIDGDEVAGGLIESFGLCDEAACDDTVIEAVAQDPNGEVWKFWVVNVSAFGETNFRLDEDECDYDPIEGFGTAADLECVLRHYCPPHTELVFRYALI